MRGREGKCGEEIWERRGRGEGKRRELRIGEERDEWRGDEEEERDYEMGKEEKGYKRRERRRKKRMDKEENW